MDAVSTTVADVFVVIANCCCSYAIGLGKTSVIFLSIPLGAVVDALPPVSTASPSQGKPVRKQLMQT